MNEEQKARLARLAVDLDGWSRSDSAWLLALVKELDEENARLGQPRATLYSESDVAQELKRAEQQLAAVTAERDREHAAYCVENDAHLRCQSQRLQAEAERDELKREVERLEEERILFTGDAARAEAERDMLRAELAEAEWLIEHAPAATLGEPDEMAWLNREAAWSRARELARLKGRT